jgi:hypothetical protein
LSLFLSLFSILSLLAAGNALALWLLLCIRSLDLHTCQLWVDEDTAAVEKPKRKRISRRKKAEDAE